MADSQREEVEDWLALFRRTRRRDGMGPHPHYWTGDLEMIWRDPDEGLKAAMADHPSPAMAYVGIHGVHWRQEQIDIFHTPLGNRACFGNARVVARQIGGKYVEGWARHDMLGSTDFVRHAWVLTPDGDPMEVTWDHTSSDYVGVIFDRAPRTKVGNIAITDGWVLNQLNQQKEA